MSGPSQLKDKCAIIGIGQTKFTRGEIYRTPVQMSIEASLKAVEDAGLKPKDIDGIIMAPLGGRQDDIITNFGIKDLKYHAMSTMGGASTVAGILNAVMAINTGICQNVLVFVSWNGYSDMRVGAGRLPVSDTTFYHYRLELERPYGFWSPLVIFSAWVNRYMHETGFTSRDLGTIAVACRKHAALNENAILRNPITIEDHQNSRLITNCLHLFDCSVECDGGGAVVITSAERAKNMRHKPVYIMGVGEGHPPYVSDHVPGRPAFLSWGADTAGKRAFQMAGITHKDLDFAEIYDAFTFVVAFQIDEIGFCKRGEVADFIKGGRIELGGELPINTHGGMMCQGHVWGVNHVVEATRQLRGQAGPAQVKDAEIGMVTGFGDVGDCSVMILRR